MIKALLISPQRSYLTLVKHKILRWLGFNQNYLDFTREGTILMRTIGTKRDPNFQNNLYLLDQCSTHAKELTLYSYNHKAFLKRSSIGFKNKNMDIIVKEQNCYSRSAKTIVIDQSEAFLQF